MDGQYLINSTFLRARPTVDRLKTLYPNVNQEETPLPRSWSPSDKCQSIGLTQNNLRVHYKGIGKSHNDAASVRTAFPIPAACGLYYFEVKIISKGRDGYMGIGLTAHHFKMNRLPGWDKQSYGYHGDDGNSFCSSGNGQPYGPTFTTGDIIGCGVNMLDNTCFYTKNGHHLGIAFRELPSKLYPTVGLQTPGEIVDANFGQEPFKFDIDDMIKELKASTNASIFSFPLPNDQGDWTAILHKMVSSYLVHHGYSLTAETFAKTTGQSFNEQIASIKNRQKILKLVMTGRMGQAIEQTVRLYPGLLENNQNLLFMLKCRQFIEMVNGSDFEISTSSRTSPVQTSVIQSTKTYQNGTGPQLPPPALSILSTAAGTNDTTPASLAITAATAVVGVSTEITTAAANTMSTNNGSNLVIIAETPPYSENQDDKSLISNNLNYTPPPSQPPPLQTNNNTSCVEQNSNHNVEIHNQINSNETIDYINDVEMENGHVTNGNSHRNGNSENNMCEHIDTDEDMEIDLSPNRKANKSGVERMLEFGRELFQMSQRLEKENGVHESNQKMLEDAFSLLAYSNPWSSPLGWQLCPSRRETVCAALNSAILESLNYSWRPPLEICIAHACELLRLMACSSLGACAFASVEDILQQH